MWDGGACPWICGVGVGTSFFLQVQPQIPQPACPWGWPGTDTRGKGSGPGPTRASALPSQLRGPQGHAAWPAGAGLHLCVSELGPARGESEAISVPDPRLPPGLWPMRKVHGGSRLGLSWPGPGPNLAQGRTEIRVRSEVKGNPVRTWWHTWLGAMMSSLQPPVLTVTSGEAGEGPDGQAEGAGAPEAGQFEAVKGLQAMGSYSRPWSGRVGSWEAAG